MDSPQTPVSRGTTACGACHRRKIKCDGLAPRCSPCLRRGVHCEPHSRIRRAGLSTEDEKRLNQRIAWLEAELGRACGLSPREVREIPTGEQIVARNSPPSAEPTPVITAYTPDHAIHDEQQLPLADDNDNDNDKADGVEKEVSDIAANVAVLSLTATGEMRFMGGPSGVLFSRLIASTVKKYLHDKGVDQRRITRLQGNLRNESTNSYRSEERGNSGRNAQPVPQLGTAKKYLTTYLQWVHLTYPIFHRATLDNLIRLIYESPAQLSSSQWTIFYLVMAIGAWHEHHLSENYVNPGLPAAQYFSTAMTWFDEVLPLDGIQGLQIILLLSIYSSYRPTGSNQWHLVGMAMRLCIDMGLHRHNPDWNFTPEEWDIRQRLFWVTYAMDRTVCFNLGRPLSLSDDHIDALFPSPEFHAHADEPSIALALHHIQLRGIQTRIISEVYTVSKSKTTMTDIQRIQILDGIQKELNDWRNQLNYVYSSHQTPHSFQWYERLYHTTTASLHRATPLFPQPSEESIKRCYEASSHAVRIYHSLLRSHEMEHSWMLISGCYLAGITMFYTLWSSGSSLPQNVRLEEVTESCRMCSNVLAVLSAKWKASPEFIDTYEALANITTKKLVKQLQQRYIGDAAGRGGSTTITSGNGMNLTPQTDLPFDSAMLLDSISWPQDFNFNTVLTNPDCITEVFGDLLREQEDLWNM